MVYHSSVDVIFWWCIVVDYRIEIRWNEGHCNLWLLGCCGSVESDMNMGDMREVLNIWRGNGLSGFRHHRLGGGFKPCAELEIAWKHSRTRLWDTCLRDVKHGHVLSHCIALEIHVVVKTRQNYDIDWDDRCVSTKGSRRRRAQKKQPMQYQESNDNMGNKRRLPEIDP